MRQIKRLFILAAALLAALTLFAPDAGADSPVCENIEDDEFLSWDSWFDFEESFPKMYDELKDFAPWLGSKEEQCIFLPAGYTVMDITSIDIGRRICSYHVITDDTHFIFTRYTEKEPFDAELNTLNRDYDCVPVSYCGTGISLFDIKEKGRTVEKEMLFSENGRYFCVTLLAQGKSLSDDDILPLSRYRRIDIGTGFVRRDGKILYLDRDGKPLSRGWKRINGQRFYIRKDGSIAVGAMRIGDRKYLFDSKGKLLKSLSSGRQQALY